MNMKWVSAALMTLAMSAGMSGVAVADQALAQSQGCLGCHTVDRKLVGPSFKEIAASGRDRTTLINSVAKGSKGVYGSMMMPPSAPRVSDGDIATLVDYILAQK